ncbi:hypothetical protein Egran_03107 [Elaphomyces granulatus]|uniref:Phytocyanin domain-containing protein n=1 Tax=Elaphomyces granulatus TaxID=519963 RepID=A0A232LY88_9EURO|nr:hypothetical protein Egran_03107 [Elaphomyces granulatus]
MTRILNHILLAVMAMILVIGGGSGHETYEYSPDTDGSGKQSSDSNSNSGQGIGITIIVSSQGGTSGKQIWNQAKATSGQVHQVTVGGTAGLIYTPDTVNAAVGDMIQFNFMSVNHTVTQSAFTTPCVKMDGGVDSGFMPNPKNGINPPPMMMFQVTSSDPVWMYCRQKGHCGKGMVFSVNPTAAKSQADFKAAAMAQNGTAGASATTPSPLSSPSPVGSSPNVSPVSPVSPGPAVATPGNSNIADGNGNVSSGGACTCSCLCAAGSFPVGAGIGATGGMGGELTVEIVPNKNRGLLGRGS